MIKFEYLGTTIRSQNYTQEANNSLVRFLDTYVDIPIEVKVEILNIVPIIYACVVVLFMLQWMLRIVWTGA
jgi:hypothetical protein